MNAKSLLQGLCEAQGFKVLFLPKFHCELNFIEMCWGDAKQTYHLYPTIIKRRHSQEKHACSLRDNILRTDVEVCPSSPHHAENAEPKIDMHVELKDLWMHIIGD